MTAKVSLRVSLLLAAMSLIAAPAGAASVQPGQKFNASNVSQIADMISPGVKWCVEHGMPITVSEYKKIEISKRYREATEKYSAQVKLSANGQRSRIVRGMAEALLENQPARSSGADTWRGPPRDHETHSAGPRKRGNSATRRHSMGWHPDRGR